MNASTVTPDDLKGVALDMAVALLVYEPYRVKLERGTVRVLHDPSDDGSTFAHWRVFSPSSRWSQGGPLIERNKIVIVTTETGELWDARKAGTDSDNYFRGTTPLVAAMRCVVGSKS